VAGSAGVRGLRRRQSERTGQPELRRGAGAGGEIDSARLGVFEVTGEGVYGETVTATLGEVQAVLDEHVGASAGRCAICGGPGPCRPYLLASNVFARSGQLPRRRPGATLTGRAAPRLPGRPVPGYVRRY
jgi:hypothetical protein